MAFNRPPRIQYKIPKRKVAIPSPQNVPSKPGETNWLMTVLPLAALLLVAIFMLFSSASMGLSYLLFLPLMLVTYLANAFNTKIQQRRYIEDLEKAKKAYAADLHNTETKLRRIQAETKKIYLRNNPSPSECARMVKQRASRLGERRVEDPDFLHIRLGTGTLPAPYEIEQPDTSVQVDEMEDEFRFASRLYKSYSVIPNAPILARLPQSGSIGIAGKRSKALDVARAMLIQIATHHWFTEVNIAVICKPENFNYWKWVQNLPHYAKNLRWEEIHSASELTPPRSLMAKLEEELQQREQFVETTKLIQEGKANKPIPLPRLIIIFDNLDINYSHPALILLRKKGNDLGVYGIFLSETVQQIPGECGAILALRTNSSKYMETGADGNTFDCYRTDHLGLKQAEEVALSLAKIKWVDHEDTSHPPDTVGFLDIFHAKKVEDLPVDKWWDGSPPMGYLKVPLGKISETANLLLNLNDEDGAHGPHGLIGGMTGSGKSELLKTLVLSLAVTHHPYDLNFALIDYKGGAAFIDLAGGTPQHGRKNDNIARLPHIVGVVTDIENNATYAERVIQSLTGEIERRKKLLSEAQLSFDLERPHIDAYNKELLVKRPFPHLIIIFDEFAEFKQRHPEESKRLISIARQGRSLGVHLILATQNIPAAVDPEILQNSSFRICLKVSEAQDSIQMVGIPDAINLNRGRAYFSSGTRILFQSAYSGKKYLPDRGIKSAPEITRVKADGEKQKEMITLAPNDVLPNSEARALVQYLDQRAKDLRLLPPPPVWPDPLPERIFLEDILFDPQTGYVRGGWDKQPDWLPCEIYEQHPPQFQFIPPVLGLVDKPLQQKQEVLLLGSSKGGENLLVLGTAGSGKSTLMQTLVVSLARTNTPDQVHIYILDFGGDLALKALETFPHVGAVVTRLESERTERLIKHIDNEIANRIHLLRKFQVDTWTEYNQRPQASHKLPVIYLLIDNFREFKRAFQERPDLLNKIGSFISGGQSTGIYLVLTSNLLEDVPESLSGIISARWTLHQSKHENYYGIVGRPSEAKKQEEAVRGMIPGRGLLRSTHPLEFQIALPIKKSLDLSKTQNSSGGITENLTLLALEMNDKWKGERPQPIETLSAFVTLPHPSHIMSPKNDGFWVMLGTDFDTLEPIGFSLDDSPAFLIADNSNGSGKTSLLHTWAVGLIESFPEESVQLHIIDFHTRTLRGLRKDHHVHSYINTKSTLDTFLEQLFCKVRERQEILENFFEENPDVIDASTSLRDKPREIVIIDDYHRLSVHIDDNTKRKFADSLAQSDELGIHFIVSGNVADMALDYSDPFLKQIKKMKTGILLGGSDGIDLFNAQKPPGRATMGLNPGRGYMIQRGKARLFQAAVIWQRGETLQEALERRISKPVHKNNSANSPKHRGNQRKKRRKK